MARAKRSHRIYTRNQGGQTRYYGDFRDFTDVGGGQEALRPPGAPSATTDPDIARQLVADRVKELEAARRNKAILGVERQASLKEYAAHHLRQKKRAGKVSEGYLVDAEVHLSRAVEYFGATRDLMSIGVRDVENWCPALGRMPGRRGETMSPQTVRHHLNALSNLYRRAAAESCVPPGYNPVAAMMEKPSGHAGEADWLEVHDAALLLEAARHYTPPSGGHLRPPPGAYPHMYPLIATYLLTGGRKAEVLGLEVEDVSFDRHTITFRPNAHRGLKTRTSRRPVPLWPQLETILREYLYGGETPRVSGLLFPSVRLVKDPETRQLREVDRTGGMLVDFDKQLDAVAERAGWKAGEIRSKMFRHTYCAARLQTLDGGAPISPYTVAKELGHGGTSLVDRVYGHLGRHRHRSEVVEYRIQQHRDRLADRLAALT
jgi:integrase